MGLLSISSDAKTIKGESLGFMTGILYLTPSILSGWQLCPNAALADCETPCLNSAGRGAFDVTQLARLSKTDWLFGDQSSFMLELIDSVFALIRKAMREGFTPLVRLNGTSDIRWENIGFVYKGVRYSNIFELFPTTQFYDYTKISNRKGIPANYDLTFSYSSAPKFQPMVQDAIAQGMRLAVVFRTIADIPIEFLGMPVVGGDNSDVRHIDPTGVVVALYAKGKGIKDKGYLVVDQYTKIIPILKVA